MTDAEGKQLYIRAVRDGFLENDQSADWWREVAAEMRSVVEAKSDRAGGDIIRWWCDWERDLSATKQARLIREEWARMMADGSA